MLLAMFHAMSENYLIEIVGSLGGDSSSVGVALFIATAVEMPVICFFDKVREKITDNWLLKLSGVFFLVKAVLFLIAPSVTMIYMVQVMQTITYCFLAPTQLFDVTALLIAGVVMAAAGTVVLFAMVNKEDEYSKMRLQTE